MDSMLLIKPQDLYAFVHVPKSSALSLGKGYSPLTYPGHYVNLGPPKMTSRLY